MPSHPVQRHRALRPAGARCRGGPRAGPVRRRVQHDRRRVPLVIAADPPAGADRLHAVARDSSTAARSTARSRGGRAVRRGRGSEVAAAYRLCCDGPAERPSRVPGARRTPRRSLLGGVRDGAGRPRATNRTAELHPLADHFDLDGRPRRSARSTRAGERHGRGRRDDTGYGEMRDTCGSTASAVPRAERERGVRPRRRAAPRGTRGSTG